MSLLLERLIDLDAPSRRKLISEMSEEKAAALLYDWNLWARREIPGKQSSQLPPEGDWRFWVICTGRGWGKTRVGAETVRMWVESGQCRRIALVSDTAADLRDVMIKGPDGLLAVCPPWNRPQYLAVENKLTWPNGAVAIGYAAEAPGKLRGPQHDGAWCDEWAKWKNLIRKDMHGETAWSNLLMGLRVGNNPRAVITTTPRPLPIFRQLINHPNAIVTRGSLYENAENLAPKFLQDTIRQYEGTRLGRQELAGEILEDTPGALWTLDMIDRDRVELAPDLVRIVIAIDPPGTDNPEGSEAGIVACGLGADNHGYVLHDISGHLTPAQWGSKAVEHYRLLDADRIIGEKNYGGQMVEHTVRMAAKAAGVRNIAYKEVSASRGKQLRAEPISALYEQGKIHHVGYFPKLEDELTTWETGKKSPNRLDALVWGFTELMLKRTVSIPDKMGFPNLTQKSRWRIG